MISPLSSGQFLVRRQDTNGGLVAECQCIQMFAQCSTMIVAHLWGCTSSDMVEILQEALVWAAANRYTRLIYTTSEYQLTIVTTLEEFGFKPLGDSFVSRRTHHRIQFWYYQIEEGAK